MLHLFRTSILAILFLTFAHCYAALADSRENCVYDALQHSGSNATGQQQSSRLLGHLIRVLSDSSLRSNNDETRREMTDIGLRFRLWRNGRSDFRDLYPGFATESQIVQSRQIGLYEISLAGLPRPNGRGTLETNAFLHPDMPRYLKKLEEYGYSLVVDPATFGTRLGNYARRDLRVIALKPEATWLTFLHEFQHVEFNVKILDRLGDLSFEDAARRSPSELRSILDMSNPMVARAMSLARRGWPKIAVNETLAVEVQLTALRNAGYIPYLSYEYSQRRDYALQHQIHQLLLVPASKRTFAQRWVLARAITERLILTHRNSLLNIAINIFTLREVPVDAPE